ncbi:hypothetical protein N510_002445 [Firmicutes bacterium ASF500]|nr:hypothetical protein N510_002445 [Firmicutes bacterium ASF500]
MNRTTNYNLCQFEETDRVRRTDFNEDNAKIDAAVKAVDRRVDGLEASKADKTALAAVEGKISRIVTGTYAGTGGSSGVRRISLPGRPKLVLIRTDYPNTSHHDEAIAITDICLCRCHTYHSLSVDPPTSGYALENNGFTVPANCDQNYSGSTQHYMAII